MPKKKKHLQFYMDCMNADGKMPDEGVSVIKGGLCRAADLDYISKDILEIFSTGQSVFSYWAADDNTDEYESRFTFNSLRQTIVLFMAAINNEL